MKDKKDKSDKKDKGRLTGLGAILQNAYREIVAIHVSHREPGASDP